MLDDTPKTGDAFGRALKAHHAGESALEFVERDDGYLDATDVGYYFAQHSEWSEQMQAAMAHATGRVLDVGCGAGRVSLYLQERGYEVTGIDVSQRAVEICRERGLREARLLDIVDIDHEINDPFDSVLLCGNNFGLVGTRSKAPEMLGRLARVTTDDARLIAQSRDPIETTNPAHLSYHDLNRERGRLPGALRMRVRYGQYATPWYDYLFVGPETMRELVAPTAWAVTETIESEHLPEYVAILEKE